MQTLRTIIVVGVLAAVGYGVYITLHQKPPGEPPEPIAEGWDQPPTVSMPGAAVGSGEAPQPVTTGPASGGVAPAFVPEAESPQTSAAAPPWGGTPPFEPAPVGAMQPAEVAPQGGMPTEVANQVAPPNYEIPAGAQEVPTHAPDAAASVPDVGAMVPGASPSRYEPTSPQQAPTSPEYAERYTGQAVPEDVSAQFAASLRESQQLLDAGQLGEAHLALSQWYDHPQLSEAENAQLMELLDRIAGTVVYSQMHILEQPYEVQPGDTLERVGRLYNVSWQLLAKINGIDDPNQLHTGDLLKVVRGPFDATVELEQYQLTLWLDGRYAGRFPIGIGRDFSTPEGDFVVRAKVENPTYYGPDRVIDADDPANPLGERWIDLGNQLGIHGTNEPQSIGRSESRGCIRLNPQDIQDVYDILSVGSRVIIRR